QSIIVCGCSDGAVEVACLERNKLIGLYLQSRIGIVHILFTGSRVVLARLDGSIEFLELLLTSERPTRVTSITLLKTVRAHQKPISFLLASSLTAVSASYDHTLKLFDLRSCHLQSMLHAHRGPVTAVCIDATNNVCLLKSSTTFGKGSKFLFFRRCFRHAKKVSFVAGVLPLVNY
ncbi:hypothetical protein OESDEN_02167, partial [Oesophagostomum dentatum]